MQHNILFWWSSLIFLGCQGLLNADNLERLTFMTPFAKMISPGNQPLLAWKQQIKNLAI